MALGDPADAATGLTEGWKRTHTWMTTRNLNVTRRKNPSRQTSDATTDS